MGGNWSAVRSYVFLFIFLLVGCGSGIGLLGKLPLLKVVLPLPSLILSAGCVILLCLPLFWRVAIRYRWLVSLAFAVLFTFVSLVIFPKTTQLHASGHGSDQATCVIVAAKQLTAFKWPYNVQLMWSHNAMSCGAGWVLLQAVPIHFVGYGLTQLLFCFGSIAVIWKTAGERVALMLLAMITLCPGVWLSAANGADFLSFGIVLAAIVVVATQGTQSATQALLFNVVAVLVYQFRTPIVVMPGLLRKRLHWARSAGIALLAITMQIAFFLWDPFDYVVSGPMHLIRKAFGSTIFLDKPHLLIVVVVASTLCLLAVTLWIGRMAEPTPASLGFLMLFLGIPAFINLAQRLHQQLPLRDRLGSWEGGPWLSACIPLAALAVLQDEQQQA